MSVKFTEDNFQTEVMEAEMPVMVDCYADWCGPCKMMAPLVDEMAEKFAGKIKIGKLNVDESPDIARKYRVMSIPTFLFLKNGEVVNTIIGGIDPSTMEKALNAVL